MSTSMFDEYDIFKTMHPVKLQVMKELAENMQGKSMKDAAPLLMAATTKLKNHNLSFSPEESKVLLEILTRNMSPQEKAKVEMMKNVVARQQKKSERKEHKTEHELTFLAPHREIAPRGMTLAW